MLLAYQFGFFVFGYVRGRSCSSGNLTLKVFSLNLFTAISRPCALSSRGPATKKGRWKEEKKEGNVGNN